MPGLAGQVVEECVGVEIGIPVVLPYAAVGTRSLLVAHIIHLYGAFAGFIRTIGRGSNTKFLDVVNARILNREEAILRFQQVILDVDPVKRDVDGAGRQSFKERVA